MGSEDAKHGGVLIGYTENSLPFCLLARIPTHMDMQGFTSISGMLLCIGSPLEHDWSHH